MGAVLMLLVGMTASTMAFVVVPPIGLMGYVMTLGLAMSIDSTTAVVDEEDTDA